MRMIIIIVMHQCVPHRTAPCASTSHYRYSCHISTRDEPCRTRHPFLIHPCINSMYTYNITDVQTLIKYAHMHILVLNLTLVLIIYQQFITLSVIYFLNSMCHQSSLYLHWFTGLYFSTPGRISQPQHNTRTLQ